MSGSSSTSPRAIDRRQLAGAVAALAVVAIGVVVVLNRLHGNDVGYLTRDIAATTHQAPWIGFLSQLSLMGWAVGATFAFTQWRVVREADATHEYRAFLRAAVTLTLLLLFDDAFLMHENLLPGLGVPEPVVFVLYGGLMGLFLLRFRSVILSTDIAFFAVALGFLGASAVVDQLVAQEHLLLEDGAKFVGILCWAAFFAQGEPAWVRAAVVAEPVERAAERDAGEARVVRPAA